LQTNAAFSTAIHKSNFEGYSLINVCAIQDRYEQMCRLKRMQISLKNTLLGQLYVHSVADKLNEQLSVSLRQKNLDIGCKHSSKLIIEFALSIVE
jgi:hypothetical protein